MIASASKTQFVLTCQFPFRPDVLVPAEESTPDQIRGTGTHQPIEATLLGQAVAVSPVAAPFFASWLAWWQTQPFGEAPVMHVERPLAYDTATDTARFLEIEGREYGTGPREIAGRPDLIVVQPGRVIIADWKTGEDWAGYTADSAPAQLRTYALAAARIFGVDEAVIMPVKITPDGCVPMPEAIDFFELATHAEKLRAAMSNIENALPQPGGHCIRCPALAICPAHDTTALEQAHEIPLVTLATAGPMLLAAKAAAKRIEQIERACEVMVRASPDGVPMPDGGRLEIRSSPVEKIKLDGPNGAEAEAIIIRAGAGAAIERPAPKATKGAIEKALGKGAGVLLDELRGLGALGVSHETTRMVVTPPAGEVKPKRARAKKADVVVQGEARPAEGAIVVRAEVSADVAVPAEPAPVVAPDPLADFMAACKAAQTLDDLKTLRATFAATPFPGTTHTTARSALNVADRRINRS